MGVNQNGNHGNRQTQEESKPDIDISPEVKTKRLPGCHEKLVNLFRDINSHTRLVFKVDGQYPAGIHAALGTLSSGPVPAEKNHCR